MGNPIRHTCPSSRWRGRKAGASAGSSSPETSLKSGTHASFFLKAPGEDLACFLQPGSGSSLLPLACSITAPPFTPWVPLDLCPLLVRTAVSGGGSICPSKTSAYLKHICKDLMGQVSGGKEVVVTAPKPAQRPKSAIAPHSLTATHPLHPASGRKGEAEDVIVYRAESGIGNALCPKEEAELPLPPSSRKNPACCSGTSLLPMTLPSRKNCGVGWWMRRSVCMCVSGTVRQVTGRVAQSCMGLWEAIGVL